MKTAIYKQKKTEQTLSPGDKVLLNSAKSSSPRRWGRIATASVLRDL